MAIFNLPNYLQKDGFGMSLNIRRGNPNPLDNSSVWASLDAAKNYAKTDSTAYVGQVLTVVTDTTVNGVTVKTTTAYVIDNEAGDLKEIGSATEGDNNSIILSNGALQLVGFNSESIGTLPMVGEDGKLVWKTLEDIGAGDGNTTYEFAKLEKGEGDNKEAYGFKYRAIQLGVEPTEEDWVEIPFDVYTKSEVDAAIKEVADLVGVPAEDDESTDTLYERIAAEVLRATQAESALSDRIGAAKDGETAATGVYAYVDGVVNALVNGVDPKKIDSLNDLIEWVEAHPAIVEELDARLDKVEAILDGIGDTENGEKETVKDYVDDAITAHEQAADGKYATKQEITNAGYAVATEVANTYVTKETATTDNGLRFINQTEINKLAKLNLDNGEITISGSVNANQVKELYNTVVNIVKGSTADLDPDTDGTQTGLGVEEGAEVNAIETISVNGVDNKLPIDSNRNVNITIPTKLTDLTDDIAHVTEIKVPAKTDTYESKLTITSTDKGRVVTIDDSALQNAIKAVDNSAIKAIVINNGLPLNINGGQVDITATTGSANGTIAIAGQDIAVKGLGSASFKDETHFKTKQDEVTAATEHQTNTGTVLTYVESISQTANGVVSYNTKEYNAQTAIINPLTTKIESIYKNVDGTESGTLVDKINALKTNEIKANTDAIAALAGTGNTSTVKKNADDIATINGQIAIINGSDSTEGSMRKIAKDAAFAVQTAAMEFMGAIAELPTGLTEADKGHFYKVIADINVGSNINYPSIDESYVVNGTEAGKVYANVIPSNEIGLNSIEVILSFDPAVYNPDIPDEYTSYSQTYTLSPANNWVIEYDWSQQNVGGIAPIVNRLAITAVSPDSASDVISFIGITNVDPMDITTIQKNDSIVWNGHMWYVIPSGDDIENTWRPISSGGITIDNTAALELVKGNNIDITLTKAGVATFEVPLATMARAGVVKGYTASTEDGTLTKNMVKMEDGKITEVSTDLLRNGLLTLILDGGNANA